MRVLLTGASGFLGRHLVQRFDQLGWVLDLVDLEPLPSAEGIDLALQADAHEVLRDLDTRYDLAIHLAAYVAGRVGIEGNPLGVASNMSLDAAFFSFAARTRPKRCIYLSSSAVYPLARQTDAWDGRALREDEVDLATGPLGLPDLTYGWAKLTGEYLARVLQEEVGVRTAVYRPFSVFGPGQSTDYPMTAICERAIAQADPLAVWGPGTQLRDFVYVDDFLDCIFATYERLDAFTPLNIASGVGTDFLTVAEMAAAAMGYRPEVVARKEMPYGVYARVGCPERMSGWFNPVVPLADGLKNLMQSLQVAGTRDAAM